MSDVTYKQCAACDGAGKYGPRKMMCDVCAGSGQIRYARCPICLGAKTIPLGRGMDVNIKCIACDGAGTVCADEAIVDRENLVGGICRDCVERDIQKLAAMMHVSRAIFRVILALNNLCDGVHKAGIAAKRMRVTVVEE